MRTFVKPRIIKEVPKRTMPDGPVKHEMVVKKMKPKMRMTEGGKMKY